MENEEIKAGELEIIQPDYTGEVEVWSPGKAPISFLRCSTCYLRKDCPYNDPTTEGCALQELERIDTTTPEGIIGLIESVLAAQAVRVLRFIKIEEAEGGFPDPSVTGELMTFVSLVEKFKKILSDDDFLVIRAKGKSAQGVLDRLFGDIEK